jgi:hypothetical protein
MYSHSWPSLVTWLQVVQTASLLFQGPVVLLKWKNLLSKYKALSSNPMLPKGKKKALSSK